MRLTTKLLIGGTIFLSLKNNLCAQISDSSIRKVNLQGAANFRDIGGYSTATGKIVSLGKIYRSAEISKLTDVDIKNLEDRNITVDIDFRGQQEANQAPDKLWKNVDYLRCGAGSEKITNWMASLKTVHNGDSLMRNFYRDIDSLGMRYKELFQKLLLQKKSEAIVYHCSAGKDRTGIATALILYVLGVPKQTIMDDYEASNYYRKAENIKMANMIASMGIDRAVVNDMMTVKASYLETTFNALINKYGSIDNFLAKELGIGSHEKIVLQEKYLN